MIKAEEANLKRIKALEETLVRLIKHLIKRRQMPYKELSEIVKPLGIKIESPDNPGVFIYHDDGSKA